MAKVITFSRVFPAKHPRMGEATYFVEKFWKSLWDQNKTHDIHLYQEPYDELFHPFGKDSKNVHQFTGKNHTIRTGHRFKAGDYFSPRVWGNDINPKSGRSGPYQSRQIVIAPDVKIEKVWDFEVSKHAVIYLNGVPIYQRCDEYTEKLNLVAKNDGLETAELLDWFNYPMVFDGQIICWNENIEY